MKNNTLHKTFKPEISALFLWANRHRAKPFPQITRWQIDGNLLVSAIEVRHV